LGLLLAFCAISFSIIAFAFLIAFLTWFLVLAEWYIKRKKCWAAVWHFYDQVQWGKKQIYTTYEYKSQQQS
jgi:hypothetical protein